MLLNLDPADHHERTALGIQNGHAARPDGVGDLGHAVTHARQRVGVLTVALQVAFEQHRDLRGPRKIGLGINPVAREPVFDLLALVLGDHGQC